MNDEISFVADLRYPVPEHSGERWSQWSSLPMIELSALSTYRFVQSRLSRSRLRILEIGCGNGYLTLELARDGHEVIGIDKSREIIEVAERSRVAHPDMAGTLQYYCADFLQWEQASFDIIIFNRTLHHLAGIQAVMTKVKQLLKSDGHIICQDYAYDRLDDRTATWLYAMQKILFLNGVYKESPTIGEDESLSIESMRQAWFKHGEHHLNKYEDMQLALNAIFHAQHLSWYPYLFVYVGNDIYKATPEQERALITFLRDMEHHLITQEYIQAVGFRYMGSVLH